MLKPRHSDGLVRSPMRSALGYRHMTNKTLNTLGKIRTQSFFLAMP